MTAACSPVEDDDAVAPTCLRGEGIGYDERVTDELALVEQYVGGSNRLYDVATDGVCYQADFEGTGWGDIVGISVVGLSECKQRGGSGTCAPAP